MYERNMISEIKFYAVLSGYGEKGSIMKTCRSIINRYFVKDEKTYAVCYALTADRQLVSKTFEVADDLRIGGYIKAAKPVTITVEGDKLVSIMSDAEVEIYNKLLADLEPKPEPEPADVELADLASLLGGEGVQ